eukprot:scaffold3.g6566.t1
MGAVLALLLLASCAARPAAASLVGNVANAVSSFFGGSNEDEKAAGGDPVATKTARALYVALGGNSTSSLQFGQGAQAPSAAANSSYVPIPFLRSFLYTAEGPAALVDQFSELAEGPGPEGSLMDAVDKTMGGAPVLHAVCVGDGPASGLALLCGAWAGLALPTANVDALTFGSNPAAEFNTQFQWAFDQLVTLFYLWRWSPAEAGLQGGGQAPQSAAAVAAAIRPLITRDAVTAATVDALGSLPPSVPPQYSSGEASQEELDVLAPVEDPDLRPEPRDCPFILCKTRVALAAACEGIILWQGSESKIDWLQDAIAFFSDDFRPGNLSALLGQVKVHRGFLNQFSSLTTGANRQEENITAALLSLSGGTPPAQLVVAGHSLGAALSELTGVWVSTLWPNVSVLVANSGAPMVGNTAWRDMFRAVVGRAYRYVNHVPEGMWLRDDLVLLQDRPYLPLNALTWNDHNCETLYTPQACSADERPSLSTVAVEARIQNATNVAVPGFIFNVSAA